MSQTALPQTFSAVDSSAIPSHAEHANVETSGIEIVSPSVEFADGVPPGREFDYRPVPIAAPVALFLGFCSILGLFTFIGLGLGLFGTLLGAICLYRIRQSKGELGGKWIAATGCMLSLILLISGSTLHAHAFATEVPEGYQRVNFTRDISKKPFLIVNGQQAVNPDVIALNDQKIFIKGFMYPEKSTKNLTSFLLVKDNQQCCFGGQPELNDMIMVTLEKGKKFDYHPGLIAVTGTFHAVGTKGPAGLSPIYSMEAVQAEKARTNF